MLNLVATICLKWTKAKRSLIGWLSLSLHQWFLSLIYPHAELLLTTLQYSTTNAATNIFDILPMSVSITGPSARSSYWATPSAPFVTPWLLGTFSSEGFHTRKGHCWDIFLTNTQTMLRTHGLVFPSYGPTLWPLKRTAVQLHEQATLRTIRKWASLRTDSPIKS